MATIIDPHVLRAMREAKGWDQLTLSKNAGVDPSVVFRIERGTQEDLKASVLVTLARALETSVDSLLNQPPQPIDRQLILELDVSVANLKNLSPPQQRQVAAILRGYLAAIPE